MMIDTIRREEYTYHGRRVILDAARLPGGGYETMLLARSSGLEYASARATTEAEALAAYDKIRAAHLPDNERPADEPAPLTGKYAQLRDNLRKVHKIGLEAAAGVEDGGTCNMDAPALRLTRWNTAKVEQACKEAGGGCFKWSLCGRFVICLPTPGQAYKQETAAEAMTKALQALGYDAMTYSQMD